MLSSVALGLVLAVTSTAATIYSQMVLDSSASMWGLAFAMLSVAWTALALLTAPLLQSLGVRLTGVLGAATIGVGCLIFILVIVLDGGL